MIGTQCPNCKHYQGVGKCLAFPKGIPPEIMTGQLDHSRPIKNDQGIRFEAIKR